MKARPAGTPVLLGFLLAVAPGCLEKRAACRPEPWLRRGGPAVVPSLPPPPPPPTRLPAEPAPAALPAPAPEPDDPGEEPVLPPPREVSPDTPLELSEVLQSVDRHFPLLLATRQERAIAAGKQLSAEGGFDLNLRAQGLSQGGSFPSNRLDLLAEQPTPFYGVNFFSGYRFGFGDFPVYYGNRLTADGGEFRAGVRVPLLRDRPIDRRRAALLQADQGAALAEPVIGRARIDAFQAASRAYWGWVGAGAQYAIAEALLRLAKDRQAGLEEQFKKGLIAEFVVIDNRRLIVDREGRLIAAERRWQQTSFELSLYLRDAEGNPVVPAPDRLPPSFLQLHPQPPRTEGLPADVELAYRLRPELVRFRFLKEQAGVELRLAKNQTLPALDAVFAGAQDMGKGKKAEGIFALDRSLAVASLVLEVPLQRREARGRVQAARAALMQLLAQERFARDRIGTQVQDAVSDLDRTFQRLQRAREEQRIARRVAGLERERFRKGQSNLLDVNLRELAAAGAQSKVADALTEYFRARADYRAALGLDGAVGGTDCPGPP
jgi:cobalt-zinc-cadmium efflux system outer membrane protein